MLNKNIIEAELEARRFLKKIAVYKNAQAKGEVSKKDCHWFDSSKYRSAIRRASMDLTRALAKMRQEKL